MKTITGVLIAMIALPAFAADSTRQWPPLPLTAPEPKDNPTTPAKVELGKMLYFDPRFSEDGTVSCFSCHNVMEGGDDHRPTSIGVHGQKGGRNAPTVWNAAFLSSQFWDGRAGTLEDQAKGPVTNPVEMGMKDLQSAIDRIRRIPGYRMPFEAAFGPGEVITIGNAAKAIATYVTTYDLAKDQGRFESTGKESDRHMWRVPTLRNLTYTAPYMHNGAVKTIPEAVRVMGSTQLNRTLSDQEVSDIAAFLESLTGPFPTQSMPKLPPTPGDLLQ